MDFLDGFSFADGQVKGRHLIPVIPFYADDELGGDGRVDLYRF
jgi:hypothetical protein